MSVPSGLGGDGKGAESSRICFEGKVAVDNEGLASGTLNPRCLSGRFWDEVVVAEQALNARRMPRARGR